MVSAAERRRQKVVNSSLHCQVGCYQTVQNFQCPQQAGGPPMPLPFPRSAHSLLTREMPTFSCPLQPDMSKTNTPGLEHVSPNHYKSKKKLNSSRQQIIYFQLSCSTYCTNSSTDGEVTCSKVAQNLDTFDTYCDDRTSEQVRFPNPDAFLMILQKK